MQNSHAFNRRFVREIEKNKCLYDHAHPHYKDRAYVDSVWEQIAQINGCTVRDCKYRWRNLRATLARYVKDKSNNIGKYYLFDDMKFILPYTKTRDDLSLDKYCNSEDSYQDDAEENFHFDTPIDSKDFEIECDNSQMSEQNNEQIIERPLTKTRETYSQNHIRPYSRYQESNPDLDFFKSILGDVAMFSQSQKRKLKLRVLQVIDEIASENENCLNTKDHLVS